MVDERMAAAAAGSAGGRRPKSTPDSSPAVTARSTRQVARRPATVQRVITTPTAPSQVALDDDGDASQERTTTSEELDEIERIVAAVERRILSELNRRSGRYGGW
jgi:hypothetical protein